MMYMVHKQAGRDRTMAIRVRMDSADSCILVKIDEANDYERR